MGNFTFYNSMDGPREHYAQWNKPVREIQYDLTYMWNLVNKLNIRNRGMDIGNRLTAVIHLHAKTRTTEWWPPEGKGVGRRWRRAKGGKWGQKETAWGDQSRTPCADVLLTGALKTCIVLWTNVTTINSIKEKNKIKISSRDLGLSDTDNRSVDPEFR